jgi:5'(3')-deoxyribonucleotidase
MTTNGMIRKIAFDIDGVLADFIGSFLHFYNRRNKTHFRLEDIKFYNPSEVFGISREFLMNEMEEFYKSPLFKSLPPIEGSKEAIRQLYRTNLLYVVTSRPSKLYGETTLFLRNHFPDRFLKVHITNGHRGEGIKEKKSDVCLCNGYQVIIEDSADEVNDCAEKGIEAIILTRPWNIDEKIHPNARRAENWQEVARYLQ